MASSQMAVSPSSIRKHLKEAADSESPILKQDVLPEKKKKKTGNMHDFKLY